MANDPLVDARVLRAVDSSGNVHNLLCDANGNLIATSGGSAAPDQVQLVDGTTPTQKAAVSASGLLSVDTELPTAAALNDLVANPTTTVVAVVPLAYQGSTYSRVYAVNQLTDAASLAASTGVAALWLYNGTNWDRARSDPASTGRQAVADFPGSTTAANVLNGYQTFSSTTGATTLITIPQARTWVGTIGASVSAQEVAAGTVAALAVATFTTAGTNVTPAAGTYFVVRAEAGANAATGLVGSDVANSGSMPLIVVAPAGNSVTVQVASTNAGTASHVDAYASGQLL